VNDVTDLAQQAFIAQSDMEQVFQSHRTWKGAICCEQKVEIHCNVFVVLVQFCTGCEFGLAKFVKHVKRNPLPIPNAVMVRVMGVAVEKFTA